MNARTTFPTEAATRHFTFEECEAIEAAIARETAQRKRLHKEPWAIDLGYLHIVEDALFEVFTDLEGEAGYEDSHANLQAALEEADCHTLWVTTASLKAVA